MNKNQIETSEKLALYLELNKKKSSKNKKQDSNEQQLKLVRDFCTVLIAGILVVTFSLLGIWLLSNGAVPVVGLPMGIIAIILLLIARYLVSPKSSSAQIQLSILIIIGSILVVTTLLRVFTGSGHAEDAANVLVIVIGGLLGLNLAGVIITSVVSLLCLSIPFILEKIVGAYTPQFAIARVPFVELMLWWLSILISLIMVLIFVSRYRQATTSLEEQSTMLEDLLSTLNSTTEFGSSLSQELSGVTAELNSTSRDHATSSQEQVAAVTQVTASLEELSETANQIAAAALAAANSAGRTVTIATEVTKASELAQKVVKQGTDSVDQAVASVERVRNRIELLGQRLLNLTEQTRRVGTIIDIIDEIADETHLLALNASIEAAGGIENSEASVMTAGSRGDRFGVIAQEIKNLSDRSRESTEEVRQAITEMQGAVAAAVLVAEEGKKETATALSRSQISGLVIQKLNEVIADSSLQAEEILRAVEEVNIRCDEISVATGQQRTANQQILNTMRSVAQVARESAGAVTQLSETVTRVNSRVGELNDVLNQSNESFRVLSAA